MAVSTLPRGRAYERLERSWYRVATRLDAVGDVPVIVRNARMDLLGGNPLGQALFGPVFAMPGQNLARYVFLDPGARTFSPDYDRIADYSQGGDRTRARRHGPGDARR